MTIRNRSYLKYRFRTSTVPIEQDYVDLIDSAINKIEDQILYSKYQIMDVSSGTSQPIAGCYVIATGPVNGTKSLRNGIPCLEIKIPTGVSVRNVGAYFAPNEIGSLTKQTLIYFNNSTGFIGMPNNLGAVPPEFMPPNIQCYLDDALNNRSTTIVPKFSNDGINFNPNYILCTATVGNVGIYVNVSF